MEMRSTALNRVAADDARGPILDCLICVLFLTLDGNTTGRKVGSSGDRIELCPSVGELLV